MKKIIIIKTEKAQAFQKFYKHCINKLNIYPKRSMKIYNNCKTNLVV